MSSAPKPGAPFQKKGEIHELQQLMRSAAQDKDKQKKRDAIKKVIAYMTLGIDVSPLFSEMIMASATKDLVQKKMVYLYLMNYSESNSELAILAVNTLLQDFNDDDPMIRGLALRSLCSLSLASMLEYLTPAVTKGLEDVNGYVRKTAVVGAVKLFHLSSSVVLEGDILPALRRLLGDSDPHVVANTIHALQEILAEEGGFTCTRENITGLLNKLTHFSEWGQVAVLQLLSRYQVRDENEMFDIMNVMDPLLKQSSSAVVLSVTKIFLDLTSNRPDLQVSVLQRLRAPLLTLSSTATPELAYTVLVHIQSICSHSAMNITVFSGEYKQFFCRYNEPSYIKSMKIEILTLLADDNSAETIVAELSEYVTDVDAEISRRAIKAVGKIAIRLPSSAELIVGSLTNLLELDIDYVCTEAAVVMKDLVRKYPEQFERASGAIERCIKIVTEAEGKCALLWILGEMGPTIPDAPYLLEPMIDSFLEEPSSSVKVEMLTAAVKLFFTRAPEVQHMLGRLLKMAIQESQHPDVRDRSLLYYRLLKVSPEEARSVICVPKEVAENFHQEEGERDGDDRIFAEFNTLSVIYKQPAAKFVLSKSSIGIGQMRMPCAPAPAGMENMDNEPSGMPASVDMLVGDEPEPAFAPAPAPAPPVQAASMNLMDDDLLGFDTPSVPVAAPAAPPAPVVSSPIGGDLLDIADLLGGMDVSPTLAPAAEAQFSLQQGFAINEQMFQSAWGGAQNSQQLQKQMRPGVQLAAPMVTECLRTASINTIASGVMPGGVLKLFVYGKQATGDGSEVVFMCEVMLTPNGMGQATMKSVGGSPQSMTSFAEYFWRALGNFVM